MLRKLERRVRKIEKPCQKDQANNHNYEERYTYFSYNKSQRDALILNFIVVKNYICFR
jgi:hypothetical protein